MPAAALLVALGACGGSGDTAQAASACPALDVPEFTSAINQYLDGLDPQPLRFLFYATGDSALPEPAQSALGLKGPTYMWPTDPLQQEKQLESLRMKGTAVTLLVLYTGIDTTKTGSSIGFGGRYMDKADTGKTSPNKRISFQCRNHQWQTVPAAGAAPANSA